MLVVVLVAALAAGSVAGAEDTPCEADGEKKFCLTEVSLSTESMTAGQSATLDVTVRNEGNATANATVVLNTVDPNNVTQSYNLREQRLEPGEEVSLSQQLDATTPGMHGMQVLVFGDSIGHRYDASAAKTLSVEEQTPGLGGPLDRAEFALVALLGSIGVLGFMTYRTD